MSYTDLFIILIAALGAWRGYKRGFITGVICFFILILVILTLFHLIHEVPLLLRKADKASSAIMSLFMMLAVLVIAYIVVFFIGKFFKVAIPVSPLGKAEPFVAALVGIIEAVFILSLGMWLFKHTGFDHWAGGKTSMLKTWIVPVGPKVISWVSLVFPFEDVLALVHKNIRP